MLWAKIQLWIRIIITADAQPMISLRKSPMPRVSGTSCQQCLTNWIWTNWDGLVFTVADYINEVRRSLEKSPTVCRQWKIVAHTMRLHHTTVLDIEENNRHCTSNALHDVLRNWVDEFGQKATFSKLIDILKCERMIFAAGKKSTFKKHLNLLVYINACEKCCIILLMLIMTDEVEELWIKLCSTPAISCNLSW